MVGPSALFWILWLATVAICLRQILNGVLSGRGILGLPFLVCAMWLYFYGFLSLGAALYLPSLLPTWTMELGQFVALTSLIGLLLGWSRSPAIRPGKSGLAFHNPSYDQIWRSGVVLMMFALVGQYTFNSQETIDYKNTSSYWYLMFYAGYPAAGLCLLASLKGNKDRRMFRANALAVMVAALMWHNIVQARRGPLFPMVIVLAYLPYLLKRRTPNRLVVLSALGGVGFTMLAFVSVRTYTYGGDSGRWTEDDQNEGWKRALEELSISQIIETRETAQTDNEFLYHCGSIATIWEYNYYQYGTGYLTLLVHWIPRQWWPGKPSLQEGLFGGDWSEEMPNVMGWGRSNGSATGGVANSFEQFGLLAPVFWFVLGLAIRRVYTSAQSDEFNDEKAVQYVGVLCSAHWLTAQGFGAMFVPACYYVILPTMILRTIRRRTAKGNKFNQRYQGTDARLVSPNLDGTLTARVPE